MKIELDDSQALKTLARHARKLSPRALRRAEARALNRALRGARTELSKQVRKKYRVKARDVKDAVTLVRAKSSQDKPTAVLKVEDKPIPLVKFGTPRQVRKGVAVTVQKGKRRTIQGAFIVEKLGGNIFMRTSANRYPIRKLFGPTVRQLAPKALEEVQGKVLARVEKEMRRSLQREVDKATRKG